MEALWGYHFMEQSKVKQANVQQLKNGRFEAKPDVLAVEEPLEIRLTYFDQGKAHEIKLAVTMRTPGNDLELTLGFLFTEGIISGFDDIEKIWHCETVEKEEERGNVVKVNLKPEIEFDVKKQSRNFYTSSSCGVCGKSSIESVAQNCSVIPSTDFNTEVKTILKLPRVLEADQTVFKYTGGIHASALYDGEGNLEVVREDVGRHNALDKLAGVVLAKGQYPLSDKILLVSGRASFELVQKAVMLGIPIMCAVGAPSSLAVNLAQSNNMTLIGFLKNNRFNVYCGEERLNKSL
jgi:FdhD protein